eukprot:2697380-Rhodomonas_salina.2
MMRTRRDLVTPCATAPNLVPAAVSQYRTSHSARVAAYRSSVLDIAKSACYRTSLRKLLPPPETRQFSWPPVSSIAYVSTGHRIGSA